MTRNEIHDAILLGIARCCESEVENLIDEAEPLVACGYELADLSIHGRLDIVKDVLAQAHVLPAVKEEA